MMVKGIIVFTIDERARHDRRGVEKWSGCETTPVSIACGSVIHLTSGGETHKKEGASLPNDLTARDRWELNFIPLSGETFPHQFTMKINCGLTLSSSWAALVHPGDHLELPTHPLIITRTTFALSHDAGLPEEKL
jgi:hypothetical protein